MTERVFLYSSLVCPHSPPPALSSLENYQKRFMKFMLQLSDPNVKEVKLGKGIPKKYLKRRAEKKRLEEEAKSSQLTHTSTIETAAREE